MCRTARTLKSDINQLVMYIVLTSSLLQTFLYNGFVQFMNDDVSLGLFSWYLVLIQSSGHKLLVGRSSLRVESFKIPLWMISFEAVDGPPHLCWVRRHPQTSLPPLSCSLPELLSAGYFSWSPYDSFDMWGLVLLSTPFFCTNLFSAEMIVFHSSRSSFVALLD